MNKTPYIRYSMETCSYFVAIDGYDGPFCRVLADGFTDIETANLSLQIHLQLNSAHVGRRNR